MHDWFGLWSMVYGLCGIMSVECVYIFKKTVCIGYFVVLSPFFYGQISEIITNKDPSCTNMAK